MVLLSGWFGLLAASAVNPWSAAFRDLGFYGLFISTVLVLVFWMPILVYFLVVRRLGFRTSLTRATDAVLDAFEGFSWPAA